MSERLVVDSLMTADGEVVPLGPVDKDGHRVPLDDALSALGDADGLVLEMAHDGRCVL